MNYIKRTIENELKCRIKQSPVCALIGPRQCGKSTIAKKILKTFKKSIYLDLERPSDLQKLNDAEWFFTSQRENFFCIDEIQRKPEIFPLIRSLVDEWNCTSKFLLLGSASRDLLKQSSETLAGRISYVHLTPFLWKEVQNTYSLEHYIERGGFPRSILKSDANTSVRWREDFISTFLERDLLQWSGFSNKTMQRLWQMLAHLNGQTVNSSLLGNSLGVSNVTIRNYIDLLEGTFMIEILPPYMSNLGKRLVKAPKVYIADSGISGALLDIKNFKSLTSHPVIGSVWEQIVLSNLKGHFPEAKYFFYRTSAGAEIDIVMTLHNKVFAIECKASSAPALTKGTYNAIADIKPLRTFVVAPIQRGWQLQEFIECVSMNELISKLGKMV